MNPPGIAREGTNCNYCNGDVRHGSRKKTPYIVGISPRPRLIAHAMQQSQGFRVNEDEGRGESREQFQPSATAGANQLRNRSIPIGDSRLTLRLSPASNNLGVIGRCPALRMISRSEIGFKPRCGAFISLARSAGKTRQGSERWRGDTTRSGRRPASCPPAPLHRQPGLNSPRSPPPRTAPIISSFAPFAKFGGHRSVTRAEEPVQLLRKRPRQKRGRAGCQCSPPSPIAPDGRWTALWSVPSAIRSRLHNEL